VGIHLRKDGNSVGDLLNILISRNGIWVKNPFTWDVFLKHGKNIQEYKYSIIYVYSER